MIRFGKKLAVAVCALGMVTAASAGRIIANNDEWTLSNTGFSTAGAGPTTAFVQNVANYMNSNGGACNLLIYSNNFGFTESNFNTALTGAGCTVTTSTGTFNAATLSAFDGVFLGGQQFNYNDAVLTAYINGGGSAYIAAGTASIDDANAWDSFLHGFGLDFGPNYNGITGVIPTSGLAPLLTGVSQLYYNNGNTVSLFGANPNAQIVTFAPSAAAPVGLIGVYNNVQAVPEPATLALLGLGLAGFAASRRRRQ